jgi:hypothetical protein
MLMGALLIFSDGQSSPSQRALEEIPPGLIGTYRAAAGTCEGLDWTILAAIHKIETGFGKGAAVSSKGAQGPMQFMPETFEAYGVDGDRDGELRINDLEDAVFSAAHLLCANGAGDPAHLATAIWDYNHSQTYVSQVLTLASTYADYSLPGVAAAGTIDVLQNPRVTLTPQARADVETGVVDHRILSVLVWIAQRHTIAISVFKTGHSEYVEGTDRISNHYFGRAADIFLVDGAPVSARNAAARDVVLELAGLHGPLRPDELGHPFGAIGFPGGFTDADHADHIHIGFDN